MKIGKLNRLVVIEQQSATQDAIGQPVLTWTTLATVWANVRYLQGAEAIKADAVTSVAKASIRIRRRTDVTSAMRVTLGSTTFQILAVLPDEESRERLDLCARCCREAKQIIGGPLRQADLLHLQQPAGHRCDVRWDGSGSAGSCASCRSSDGASAL
jgi:SPP1 family predicted phage head-tail adaptor